MPSIRNSVDDDLMQIEFTPVVPGKGIGDPIKFIGYIDNLTTNSSPAWDAQMDMGRPDPKVLYSGYNKTIQLGFKTISEDATQHKDQETQDSNYYKLRKLGELTYPIIEMGKGFNGPHVVCRIAKVLSCYGYITSLDYSWDNESPWVDGRPVVTQVSIGIQVLTDVNGLRPEYKTGKDNPHRYFG